MSCDDYEGLIRTRTSSTYATIRPKLPNDTCPHTHPFPIPDSHCCAEGRDLYRRKGRQPAKKHVLAFVEGRENTKRSRDDDAEGGGGMTNFGKPRAWKHFRTAYKRTHPKASDHLILAKYNSALRYMRNNL